MTFKQTLERIETSKTFLNFKKQHPDAKLCAGFFILDFLSNDNKNTLDYKTGDKIFTFELAENNDITMREDKLIKGSGHPPLEEIKPEIKVEVDELKSLTGVAALDNGISAKFHKIIAVLQLYKPNKDDDNKQIWNLTCMLEQLIILNILLDADTSEIIKFERKSIMDIIKKK